MNKLSRLYSGVTIVWLILVIYVFVHYYFLDRENNDALDANGDGIVTQTELANYVKKELDRREQCPPTFEAVARSSFQGAIRGFLAGIILGDLEDAAAGAIVMSLINPIVTGIDHKM